MCVEGRFFFFKINKRDSTFIRDESTRFTEGFYNVKCNDTFEVL